MWLLFVLRGYYSRRRTYLSHFVEVERHGEIFDDLLLRQRHRRKEKYFLQENVYFNKMSKFVNVHFMRYIKPTITWRDECILWNNRLRNNKMSSFHIWSIYLIRFNKNNSISTVLKRISNRFCHKGTTKVAFLIQFPKNTYWYLSSRSRFAVFQPYGKGKKKYFFHLVYSIYSRITINNIDDKITI